MPNPRLPLLAVLFAALSATPGSGESAIVFSIGTRDRSFVEFSRKPPAADIVFRVDRDSASAWPAYQAGTFDVLVGRSTMERDWTEVRPAPLPSPRIVEFTLPDGPSGTFLLHLDAIVRQRRPALPRYTIAVNGRAAGSYRIASRPAPELWWPNGGESDGNLQYFGYATLDVPLPASLFRTGTNRLAIDCVDGFGIFYDDLSLTREPAAPARVSAASVEATPLYRMHGSDLVEIASVRVRTTEPLGDVMMQLTVGSHRQDLRVQQTGIGDVEITAEVPALDAPVPVTLRLAGVERPLFEGTWSPRRRWKVYALPMEQADFGYNDLPARTLEWENRFVDRTLEIQAKYPDYSFTLDAAANLESYLATRQPVRSGDVLTHLRSGRWGLNALYANFFTGLMTPEEIHRALEYALRAGRQHGFVVDSASQTDEPSIAWAVPQLLADAGIKYFTNGSDPIRGALNPIGLLNFRSPFYWETPTGARLLVWSGVSYTAVDDMTWGGWNAESVAPGAYSPSIQGLTRSLPLFLSQYDRSDYAFDAVQLFGLHNDEIPMRHWGDADVIALWNREYAFPKIIPAPQRDFFEYVTSHFGDRIATIRGDGGAYWEDEAGADARIAAMNRSTQTQLAEAEMFESLAGWLQPHLRFDPRPFDDAWKHLLLADSYVWSDANSYRRPESYRTREGEAAHRSYAETARQQAKDLRLAALDKVAGLVGAGRQGVVVVNSESRPRGGFFEVELEPGEVLVDPAGGAVPCAAMRSLNGYHDVRCRAAEVPALGYKFYATTGGLLAVGDSLPLDKAAPTVNGTYYTLTLDPSTGAIAHLIDRETGTDLVDRQTGYALNEYLYVSGGDPGGFLPGSLKDNSLLAADLTLPRPVLAIHHAAALGPPEARRYPWGIVVTVRAKAENTPELISTITLPDAVKQVDIRNEVQKRPTLKKEAVYFAFPFAVSQPRVLYQGATAWTDPQRDMLPGANRQWFVTQGGVWLDGARNRIAWAAVDAPLVTLGDINRGTWPTSLELERGTIFSYAMNNYWYTDTPAQQGGRFTFQYSLTSGPDVSLAQAQALATGERAPLGAIRHYDMGWSPLLADTGEGLLSSEPSGVRILTIRPAAADGTYLIRIHNGRPDAVSARLRFPRTPVRDAHEGSQLGEPVAPVQFSPHEIAVSLGRYQVKTVIVRLGPPGP